MKSRESCECGQCAYCWYRRVRNSTAGMATWELRDEYEYRPRAVTRELKQRGYKVLVPSPPHSGPVRVVAA